MIKLLAKSIELHFILDEKRKDKLISNDDYEDSPILSMVIFVGLCNQYGIASRDVEDYLGIDRAEHLAKLKRFKALSNAFTERILTGDYTTTKDIVYRFFSKYRMCLRWIQDNANKKTAKEIYMWRHLINR